MNLKGINEKFGLFLIDLFIVLSGIALLLLMGYIGYPVIKTLFEGIGTGLISAGFVSYLIRKFYSREQHETIKVAAENRAILESDYRQRKYQAHDVDIIGIALSGCLKELADDPTEKMLKRVLFHRARLRLIFLNPSANYVGQRAMEDSVSTTELQEILKQSVIYCIRIYERLRNLYQSAVRNGSLDREETGRLEIRMTDLCPHFTIFRTDDKILWGIYTAAGKGLDSPALHVPKGQSILFDQLVRHFERLWDKNLSGSSVCDNYLVRYYDPNIPTLNEELLARILGVEWKERYLRSN